MDAVQQRVRHGVIDPFRRRSHAQVVALESRSNGRHSSLSAANWAMARFKCLMLPVLAEKVVEKRN
jgi:hypothetical protein